MNKTRVLARSITLIMSVILVMSVAPVSVSAVEPVIDVNSKSVLYTPSSDYKSGDCILSSTKTMIRRAAIQRGSRVWAKTTNKAVRKDATIFGLLLHRFSYNADGLKYTVRCGYFTSKNKSARIMEFEKLLKDHPEGVVVWGSKASIFGMHGVLLTDVKDGVPYVADSAYNKGSYSKGIQKWSDSSMKNPMKCTQYWYIKEISLAKSGTAPANGQPLKPNSAIAVDEKSTLKVSGAIKPSEITLGNGFPVCGTISSNYKISKVWVYIINSNGEKVIAKTAKPNDWNYDLGNLDNEIRFGTLSAGSYTYKVIAKDEKRKKTLVKSSFVIKKSTVVQKNATINVKADETTLSLSSANAPSSIKKGKIFRIKGTVKSDEKLKSVKIQVLDDTGEVVLVASENTSDKTYNLKRLDDYITFGALAKGWYRYQVIATNTKGTRKLINVEFRIK